MEGIWMVVGEGVGGQCQEIKRKSSLIISMKIW